MKLVDKILDKEMQNEGCLLLSNTLSLSQVDKLTAIYNNSKLGEPNGGLYTNIQDLSYEDSKNIETRIVAICKPTLDKLLQDYYIVNASFLIKGTGSVSDSRLHQDWTIIDEKKYKSALVWIPLIDVDEKNGCLQVLPKSHRWFSNIRSSSYTSIFLKFNWLLNIFLKAIPMQKKDIAIFYMNLFHGSKINTTSLNRPAVAVTIIDKSADFIHYIKHKDKLLKIQCDKDFLYNHSFNLNSNSDISSLNLNILEEINLSNNNYNTSKGKFYITLIKERLKLFFK